MEDAINAIMLSFAFETGTAATDELFDRFGTAASILEAGKSGALKGVSFEKCVRGEAERITEECVRRSIRVITLESPEYPSGLRQIPGKPFLLYARGGRLPDFDHQLAVSVVGTRKMTPYGRSVANALGFGLAQAGAVVVSGMADGIDSAAHRGALKANGVTVAVLGCGADVCYPAHHYELKRFIEASGTVLSEYAPGVRGLPYHFPQRNRIIAGLSRGVVVVEADVRSGSLITARYANEFGRDVYAVPNTIGGANSAGVLNLIDDGAQQVRTCATILENYQHLYGESLNFTHAHVPLANAPAAGQEAALPPEPKQKAPPRAAAVPQKQPVCAQEPSKLGNTAAKVYETLGNTPKLTDEIAQSLSMSAGMVLAALTELEIYGLITVFPGKRFAKKQN